MKKHKRYCLVNEDDRYPCTCFKGERRAEVVIHNAQIFQHNTGLLKVLDLRSGNVYCKMKWGSWKRSNYKKSDLLTSDFRSMGIVKNFKGFNS